MKIQSRNICLVCTYLSHFYAELSANSKIIWVVRCWLWNHQSLSAESRFPQYSNSTISSRRLFEKVPKLDNYFPEKEPILPKNSKYDKDKNHRKHIKRIAKVILFFVLEDIKWSLSESFAMNGLFTSSIFNIRDRH